MQRAAARRTTGLRPCTGIQKRPSGAGVTQHPPHRKASQVAMHLAQHEATYSTRQRVDSLAVPLACTRARVQPSPGCLCAAPPPGASPLMASTRSHRSPSQRHGHTPHRPCAARAKGSRRMQRLSEMAFRPSPPRAAERVAVGRRGRRRRSGERGGPARKKR